MMGASLSRWSMSYFAAALAALILAVALMALGFGWPAAPLAAPATLILVHVVALGWLSLLMAGALLQFLPVLVAHPLFSDRLSLPALGLLLAGLAALLAGFLQLDGAMAGAPSFLPLGALLLLGGFALVLWNLARTVVVASLRPLPVLFVIVGLLSVVATALLGTVFAFALSGLTGDEAFAALTALGVPLHALAGLGGWLGLSAMGVSYRLLAMFMLAPELDRRLSRLALWAGTGALAVAVVGGVVLILLGGDPGLALLLALALGVAALGAYGADMLHLYRKRRRPVIELNSRMAAVALGALGLAVVLLLVLLTLGRLGEGIGAVVFLIAFGWLTGLGLAQLYKIVAFMTWLECYGPILGKRPTPRVQDLVVEGRARKWFVLHYAATGAGTLALLAGQALLFRLLAALMLLATAGIAAQLLRTRRLADVAPEKRLPEGVRMPVLLRSSTT
ncbi:MAG: hypothetical protein IT542_10550 [Rubellimicrobium sp.]|nr:hypothetical protein [Rubellimicrobium sp.]